MGFGGEWRMTVEHWDEREDGPLCENNLRRKLERRGYMVNRFTYPPGTFFADHFHNSDKIDAVLSGRFKMNMNGESVLLEAGDCLEVPRGTVHSAGVVGNQSVVSLDASKE